MAAITTRLKFQTRPAAPEPNAVATVNYHHHHPTAVDSSSSSTATTYITRNHYQIHKLNTPIVFSPDRHQTTSAAARGTSPSPLPVDSSMPPSSSSDLKIRYSPSTMGSFATPTHLAAATDSFAPSFCKFNSALTAGLLNPMSPPPLVDKSRSIPTVYEMMANVTESHPRATSLALVAQNDVVPKLSPNPPPQDKQKRLMDVLALRSPNNPFNDVDSGDVKLKLSSKDGVSVSISVHRQILMAHSRFFALKLNEKRVKQQRSLGPYVLKIDDCDDIEIYIETLRLMYCKDLRKKLMKEDVPRVLAILKVSVAIGFDGGVLSCLEYLEAAPWAEDEEEKVASLLIELRLEGIGATEVLKRGSLDATPRVEDGNNNEQVLNSGDDCPNIQKGFEVWWRRVFWRQKW